MGIFPGTWSTALTNNPLNRHIYSTRHHSYQSSLCTHLISRLPSFQSGRCRNWRRPSAGWRRSRSSRVYTCTTANNNSTSDHSLNPCLHWLPKSLSCWWSGIISQFRLHSWRPFQYRRMLHLYVITSPHFFQSAGHRLRRSCLVFITFQGSGW